MTTQDHYENLLANHYTWMFGLPFTDKVNEQRQLLETLGALPEKRNLAIDLGAGSGFQAVALADLGFKRVRAVDFSPTLLTELSRHKQGRPIETIESDLNHFLTHADHGSADMIVCMGDTITHLGHLADVVRVFVASEAVLSAGGTFVLTYRDLTATVTGINRFVPVASDSDHILTCFLEYEPQIVIVHDMLYARDGDEWKLRVSAYRKLRIAVDWVVQELRKAGFASVLQMPAGRLIGIVARKA